MAEQCAREIDERTVKLSINARLCHGVVRHAARTLFTFKRAEWAIHGIIYFVEQRRYIWYLGITLILTAIAPPRLLSLSIVVLFYASLTTGGIIERKHSAFIRLRRANHEGRTTSYR